MRMHSASLFLQLLPYLAYGTVAAKTVKLNYVASTNGKAHQTKSSLEASCHRMSLAIHDILSGTAIGGSTTFGSKDMVDIHCQDFVKNSYCHLLISYDDSILIQSTVATYDSSSPMTDSSIIEADVSLAYDKSSPVDMEAIAQESLISLATDGLQKAFALEPGADASWTIIPWAEEEGTDIGNTLGQMVLSKHINEVNHKRRLYSSHNIQVWEYSTSKDSVETSKVISVFVNQVLRFTTATMSSNIHAEALTHPAMISHPAPRRVLVVSDFPAAILNELQKYDTSLVECIHVAYAHPEAQKISERFLFSNFSKEVKIPVTFYPNLDHLPNPEESDEPFYQFWDDRNQKSNDYMDPGKNKYQKSRSICYDEKIALANKLSGYDWERHAICGKNTIQALKDGEDDEESAADSTEDDDEEYDVILMDIPSYLASEWLLSDLHRKLKGLLDDEDGILALSVGSPPSVDEFLSSSSQQLKDENKGFKMSLRDNFLRDAARHPKKHGIGYGHVAVYDEPLASPLASAFIITFRSMYFDSYARFYRTSSAAIDIDVIHRLVPKKMKGSTTPPTIIYDGSTHLHYKIPSRPWEIWYCNTVPGINLPACKTFRSDIFDLNKHRNGVEVRRHPLKGRAAYATENMAVNDFINIGDTAHQFTIDYADWEALNKFVERFPEATKYKDFRDWILAYGYEALTLGVSGWSAAFANNNTFVNHACSDQEVNTGGCNFIFVSEDNEPDVSFSPVINRHPHLAGISQCAIRNINAGDEIVMDYSVFAPIIEERPYFQLFLTEMCQGGKGLVVGDKDQQPTK